MTTMIIIFIFFIIMMIITAIMIVLTVTTFSFQSSKKYSGFVIPLHIVYKSLISTYSSQINSCHKHFENLETKKL